MNEVHDDKVSNKTFSIFFSIIIILALILSVYFVVCRSRGKIAFIGSYAFIRVVSSSMEPTILTNDYIKVKKISDYSIKNVKVGDIIVFYSRDPIIYGKLNTHRVQKIDKKDNKVIYITRGDNNPANDSSFVYQNDIVAVYIRRSLILTKLSSIILSKYIILIIIFTLFGILIYYNISGLIKKRKNL